MLASIEGATEIGHAAGASDAIRRIIALQPDAVVLDLQLAEGTGFDVLRAVRERAPATEFYMLTNFAAEPYRRLAARLGAREFFDKTSEFQGVRAALAARVAQQSH